MLFRGEFQQRNKGSYPWVNISTSSDFLFTEKMEALNCTCLYDWLRLLPKTLSHFAKGLWFFLQNSPKQEPFWCSFCQAWNDAGEGIARLVKECCLSLSRPTCWSVDAASVNFIHLLEFTEKLVPSLSIQTTEWKSFILALMKKC